MWKKSQGEKQAQCVSDKKIREEFGNCASVILLKAIDNCDLWTSYKLGRHLYINRLIPGGKEPVCAALYSAYARRGLRGLFGLKTKIGNFLMKVEETEAGGNFVCTLTQDPYVCSTQKVSLFSISIPIQSLGHLKLLPGEKQEEMKKELTQALHKLVRSGKFKHYGTYAFTAG